jgi:cellulose synthase/poly-beta-1,6-N-acetylglucosamine synthase-like glycosyltransferase
MTSVFECIFWFSVCWLGYVYLGYPVALWFIGLFRSFRPIISSGYLPKVSVLLSARNEQKDIGWKITETLSWNYPDTQLEMLIASDASEDDTDEILRDVTDIRLRYLRLEERRGKNEALNQLEKLATGELLFFSDANSHIEPDCLARVVRHFSDPRVGCVTGSERTIRDSDVHGATAGIRATLGYEAFVTSLESKLGSVLVCDGSIFCIRRNLFHRLQADLANDLELPVHAAAGGYAVLFDPSALSFEKASPPQEEFHRKQRISGQGALGVWRLRHLISGFRAWQFFTRKVLRWLGPIPLALILISSLALITIPFYAVAVAVESSFLVLALIGGGFVARKRHGSWLTALPFYFLLANLGAFSGVLSAICGERFSVWESPTHSRGAGNAVPSSRPAHDDPALVTPEGSAIPRSITCHPEFNSEKYRP